MTTALRNIRREFFEPAISTSELAEKMISESGRKRMSGKRLLVEAQLSSEVGRTIVHTLNFSFNSFNLNTGFLSPYAHYEFTVPANDATLSRVEQEQVLLYEVGKVWDSIDPARKLGQKMVVIKPGEYPVNPTLYLALSRGD